MNRHLFFKLHVPFNLKTSDERANYYQLIVFKRHANESRRRCLSRSSNFRTLLVFGVLPGRRIREHALLQESEDRDTVRVPSSTVMDLHKHTDVSSGLRSNIMNPCDRENPSVSPTAPIFVLDFAFFNLNALDGQTGTVTQ